MLSNFRLAVRTLVEDAVRHRHRHPVAGPGHRRQHRDLLAVRPHAAAAAAGARPRGAGQPGDAAAQAGVELVQPGGRLRVGVQLPDVPRPRAGPDGVHRPGGALPDGRQPRGPRPDHERRRRGRCRAATFRPSGSSRRLGRLLAPDDDRTPGAHAVVVLSHAYWVSHFAERADVVGSPITVNGTTADHHRCRPARVRGHDPGHASARVRAAVDAGGAAARVEGPRQPPQLLGLRVRPAEARASRWSRPARRSKCRTAPSSPTSRRRCRPG